MIFRFPQKHKFALRTAMFGLALSCNAPIAMAQTATPAAEVKSRIEIAAGPAGQTLSQFVAQTGVQLLFDFEAVSSMTTQPVSGELNAAEALSRMLVGTGLDFEFVNDRTVTVTLKDAAKRKQGDLARRISRLNDVAGSARLAQLNAAPAEESAGAVGAVDAQGGMKLEEIVVTARRREEKAQSVPVAITALSQENLRENNINSYQELASFVPSLGAGGLGRNTIGISIRGQGETAGGPGVVTYLNEVPLPVDSYNQAIGGPGLYYDLENVQVLKGPQGTLFGRNTVGGAVLFQPRRPTNEFGGHLELTGGNYDNRQLDAVLNMPLVADKLLVRLAVNGQQREGYTKSLGDPNHPNGQDLDNIDYLATRATVTYRPTDALQNDLIFDHVDYHSHGTAEILSYLNPNSGSYSQLAPLFAQQQALGIRTSLPLSKDPANSDVLTTITDILRYDLTENFAIRNIFGYIKLDRNGVEDRDGTALVLYELAAPSQVQQYTEELQLQGTSLGGKLSWVMGGFFLHAPLQDYVYLNINDIIFVGDRYERKSRAGYTQGTYDLSSWVNGLKVTAGMRYTWDDTLHISQGYFGPPPPCVDPACTPSMNDSKSEALTWNVSLDYQAAANTLLYAASRRGYRPGGTNSGTLIPYDPEYVDDVEVGVKSDWALAGVPVRTNVAVFHQDYTNIQAYKDIAITPDNPVSLVGNAAGARLQGAEFDGSISPTKRLRLGVIYSWLDFKLTEIDPDISPNALTTLVNYQRNGRPKNRYGINARYELPISPGVGEVSVSANWNWHSWNGAVNQGPGAEQPANGLLTLGANWNHIGGRPLDASFFMTNALNRNYVWVPLGMYNYVGYTTTQYGEPRMWGVRLRYRFGE